MFQVGGDKLLTAEIKPVKCVVNSYKTTKWMTQQHWQVM